MRAGLDPRSPRIDRQTRGKLCISCKRGEVQNGERGGSREKGGREKGGGEEEGGSNDSASLSLPFL